MVANMIRHSFSLCTHASGMGVINATVKARRRHLRSDMRSVQLLQTKSLETSNNADLFLWGGEVRVLGLGFRLLSQDSALCPPPP